MLYVYTLITDHYNHLRLQSIKDWSAFVSPLFTET